MTPLFIATVLFIVALVLGVLELFLPSGGALGLLAVASAATAVFVAYYYGGLLLGTVFLGVVVVAVPVFLAAAVHVWPHTPIGRSVLIALPERGDDVLPDDATKRELQTLIGCTGVAQCDLLPSGAVVIGKKTYDAVSQGVPIDRGQPVQVIAVRRHDLVVRPIDAMEAQVAQTDDPLARPLADLGLEPLDDPLA